MLDRNRNNVKNLKKDEYAVVLDVFSNSRGFGDKEVIHSIGTQNYTLLELIPKPGVSVMPSQKVYIGPKVREEIAFIKRKLSYEKLSVDAKSELEFVVEEIVKDSEQVFVDFFNKAGPITLRRHAFELIGGIGKKYLKDILEERSLGEFKSFDDIKSRLGFLSNPQKVIADRLIDEIKDSEETKMLISWASLR